MSMSDSAHKPLTRGSEHPFPLLSPQDVSYEKLLELQRCLLTATRSGQISWKRHGDEYDWAAPSGVIAMSPAGISVYNDSGTRIRQFQPETDALYQAAAASQRVMVNGVINQIIAELDALEVPA
jgi:hypothetical protein